MKLKQLTVNTAFLLSTSFMALSCYAATRAIPQNQIDNYVVMANDKSNIKNWYALTSSDATNWNTSSTPSVSLNSIYSVDEHLFHVNGNYIFVAKNAVNQGLMPVYFISNDGLTWKNSLLTAVSPSNIIWANNKYFIVGHGMYQGNSYNVFTLPNFNTANPEIVPITFPQGITIQDMAWGNNQFAATGQDVNSHSVIFTSTDGTTWDQQSFASPNQFSTYSKIIWNPDQKAFLAITQQDNTCEILTSTDGKNWQQSSTFPIAQNGFSVTKLFYSNGHYFALFASNQEHIAYSSSDGKTWQIIPACDNHDPMSTICTDIAPVNNNVAIISYESLKGNAITVSKDGGKSWSTPTLFDTNNYYHYAQFIA